jgi:imidazolonepropionase-like amidohydrolase
MVRLAAGLLLTSALCSAASLIQSVTTIDPEAGIVLPNVDVLIAGERIQAAGVVAQPEGVTEVVDGRGRFLIPGLWDMHVHLWNPDNQPALYIAFGVTGVRDMGSHLGRTLELRKSIESGKSAGPHILTSGPGVDGLASSDPRLPVIVAGSPEDGRRAATGIFDSGADFIKVFSSIPLEAYLSLSERTRQLRIPFAGHLPRSVPLETAIELRQASIEHFFGFERSGEIRLHKAFRAAAVAGTRFTPTLTMHQRELGLSPLSPAHSCLVAPQVRKGWKALADAPDDKAAPAYAHLEEIVRWLRDSNAAILAGTGTGDPFTVPGASLHGELRLLQAAGLTPLQVLQSATTEPVRFFNMAGVTGSVRPGTFADLVLLEADPLVDVKNLLRIGAVWWKGRYFSAATLESLKQCAR